MDHRALPLDLLRQAVAEASTATSLRRLAEILGVGRTTLANFIDGRTHPHPRVRRRIAEWYIRQNQPTDAGSLAELQAALHVLLRGLVPQHLPAASTAILTLVEALHRVTGSPVPAVLNALQREGEEPDETRTVPTL